MNLQGMNPCIIHQENLCAKVLDFAEVMKNVLQSVNYNRSRRLNHRQFKAFLEEIEADCPDVAYFSAVRWLPLLKRFWNLRDEIKMFMERKQQDVAYFKDDNWLNDFAFLLIFYNTYPI